MKSSGFGKQIISINKKNNILIDNYDKKIKINNFLKILENKNLFLKKDLEYVSYLFEYFLEKQENEKNILNQLNLIKLKYIIGIKKQQELIIFFEKNKEKIKEYETKNIELEEQEKKLKEYYKSLDREKILFYLEYEKKLREYKELENYYKNLVQKIKIWFYSIKKIKELLNKLDKEYLNKNKEFGININNFDFIEEQKEDFFDTEISMQFLFDKLRIDGLNNGIQMFSFLSKNIFSLFDNIEGEELLDPLIDYIYSLSNEVNEDNFINVFKKILKGNIINNNLSELNLHKEKKYFLLRDFLMGFKTIIFFKKESYLYIFEVDGIKYCIKYKADIGQINIQKLNSFNNKEDIINFLKNYLKLNF